MEKTDKAREAVSKKPMRKRLAGARQRMLAAGVQAVHNKVREAEQDNVGVEAAHNAELAGESAVRNVKSRIRSHSARRVNMERRKSTNAHDNARKNPEQRKAEASRAAQKRRQKQRNQRRVRENARKAAKTAQKTAVTTEKIAESGGRFAARHPILTIIIVLILLVVFLIMACVEGASTIGSGMTGVVASSAYLASDADIDSAEMIYTEWETELQIKINGMESAYPGYDEYRYDVDDIGHNPYELMAFLTAVYGEFSYSEAESVLREIFNEQYTLSVNEVIEAGEPTDEAAEPNVRRVLEIHLSAQSFTNLVYFRMNAEQSERYNILMTTKGSRQYLYSPFGDTIWLPFVTEYYGWRVMNGGKDYHKGVDIGMPRGTDILAGQDGTVTFAKESGDYGLVAVIEDDKGLVSKYAHCSSLLVSEGQEVKAGDVIGKTGPHLHLEIMKNGRYLNPLYFAVTNDYDAGPAYGGDPGPVMGDGSYAALISEGEKHLGKPYVFGASGPNSFDCSGFVCYVLNHSGVKSVGRTNAQGLYNMCTPVSPSEAQPGDLIFFTKTYSTTKPVTHVAFYVGGDMMLHAGKPIKYATFNTRYWREHFYSFGRLN